MTDHRYIIVFKLWELLKWLRSDTYRAEYFHFELFRFESFKEDIAVSHVKEDHSFYSLRSNIAVSSLSFKS